MSYRSTLTYLDPIIQYLNDKLICSMQILQTNLYLKSESIPNILQKPINFHLMLIIILYIIMLYTNNLIYIIISILYPLLYGFNSFNETPINIDKIIILNKYWLLYALIMFIEYLLNFVLYLIPGYSYFKTAIMYIIIRNNFILAETYFNMLQAYYIKSNVQPLIKELILQKQN